MAQMQQEEFHFPDEDAKQPEQKVEIELEGDRKSTRLNSSHT